MKSCFMFVTNTYTSIFLQLIKLQGQTSHTVRCCHLRAVTVTITVCVVVSMIGTNSNIE